MILLQDNVPVKVYVSTYRDTNSKVIEFCDVPFDSQELGLEGIEGVEEESKEGQKKKSGLILEGKDKASTTLEVA